MITVDQVIIISHSPKNQIWGEESNHGIKYIDSVGYFKIVNDIGVGLPFLTLQWSSYLANISGQRRRGVCPSLHLSHCLPGLLLIVEL